MKRGGGAMEKMCGNCLNGKVDKGRMAFISNISISYAIKCSLDGKSRSKKYLCCKYKEAE